MQLSVIIPAHNPDRKRLGRTLAGLRGQTQPAAEVLLIDNASSPPIDLASLPGPLPPGTRVVREPTLGLTAARRCGVLAARGEFVVLVDDDNVLAPDYLAHTARIFTAQPGLGAIGGKSAPEFAAPPAAWWQPEFDGLLACRDLGAHPIIAADHVDPATGLRDYPACAPIGAGLALRRTALQAWLDDAATGAISDRRGGELTSGGDNDIILTLLRAGWSVGYFPELALTHLISADRVQPHYVARLNRGIAKSWVQVLHKHRANPWPRIRGWTVPFRKLKAWFTYRVWTGTAANIRWQGACGHFEGRAVLPP